MPLATRPNANYEIVLSTDAGQPEDKRPVFVFRYLNVDQWEEIAKLNDEFEQAVESSKMLDIAFQVIAKTLCDWRNMQVPEGEEIPFDIKRLRSMVSLPEATELMQAAVSQRPSPADKKKLDSQSGSNSERSASPAKE